MAKAIVFDMDGTIADLYGVEGWLDYLHREDETPYRVAAPLVDMVELVKVLNELRAHGYIVAVVSWLSKDSESEFDYRVRAAKREWLAKYNFPADEIHLVKYGTTKANCVRRHGFGQILFDDNAKVRAGWNIGQAHDVDNILGVLNELLTGQTAEAVV